MASAVASSKVISQVGSWAGLLHLLLYSTALQACLAYDTVHTDVSNTSHYKELAGGNVLVVDRLHSNELEKRQSADNSTDPGASPVTTLNTDTGLPMPFDTSLGSNFTATTCPNYFTKFLADTTFLSCLPMSLLLQNSMSFFQAVRSPSLLEKTLDVSCSSSLAVCSPLMAKIADELILPSNCQDDYARQNPLVLQAYAGLQAYEPVYEATCLKDSSTSRYWFLQAMESSNADDSYPYYTAVGLELPAGTKASCTAGLKETMSIFAGYAMQKEQPLSQTYLGCATQVNSECGQGFASTQVQSVSKIASTSDGNRFRGDMLLVVSLLILIMLT